MKYSDVQRRSSQAATAALAGTGRPADAARAAIAEAEACLAEIIAKTPSLADKVARLACGAGCSTCCHQMVGVTLAELALVAEAVAALPAGQQDSIAVRARAVAEQGQGMSQGEWWQARLRCPLLDDDGLCAVHAARPLPCRALTSADAAICRRAFAGERLNVPALAAQHGIMGHAQAGLAQALAQAGADHRPQVLGTRLAGALSPA